MSLKDRQWKKLEEEAVKDELMAGRTPESINVERGIASRMQGKPVGLPRFQHKTVKVDERSNPESFNGMVENIHDDLSLAFEEIVSQNNEIMAISHMYETERKMLQVATNRSLRRINTLLDRLENRSRKQVIEGNFHTFNHVDFIGNEGQGIPGTDSFIDLGSNQATLRTIASGIGKHDLSLAQYKVEVENAKAASKEERPFSNILKDTVNEVWRHTVTKDKVEKTSILASISLPEKVRATHLSLVLHSPKATDVTLYLSEDGQDWKEMKGYRAFEKVNWSFNQDVQHIRIRFSKDEPDFVEGTVMEYLFGASNMSLKREVYAGDSRIVSTAYQVHTAEIDKITLNVHDSVAPQTAIHYYIGVDDGMNFVEWQELSDGQTVKLHQLAEEKLLLNTATNGYGETAGENFGLTFHSLAALRDRPIAKKTNLYAGEYMWKLETKALTEEIPEAFMPTYQDWQDIRGMETSFVPIEETYGQNSWNLKASTLQKFTTYVQCEKEESVYNAELSIGSAYHQVYVNNSLVKPITFQDGGAERYRYTYRFKAGWNKIEILTYAKEAAPFKPDLYLRDISVNVYAMNESLREVSAYDLFNNTPKRAVDRFAVEDGKVLINYDPKALDVTGRGVRYVLEYSYLPKDARLIKGLRFMAIMSREDVSEHITPILKSYKLILE